MTALKWDTTSTTNNSSLRCYKQSADYGDGSELICSTDSTWPIHLIVDRLDLGALRYAEAQDWRGLVNVFTKSLSDSTVDEMILLLYSKAPKCQGWVSRYVRTVMHENLEEIPSCLLVKISARTDTRTPADPSTSFPTSEGHPVEPDHDDGQQKHPALPEEDVLSPANGEPAADIGGQDETSASAEEIQAALAIEAAYHRVVTRRKEVLRGIDATRARFWTLLRDRASSMEWSGNRRYKLLMQGPLVHVLVCLHGIKVFADQTNRDSNRQLRGDDHSRLEELIERSDRSRYIPSVHRIRAILISLASYPATSKKPPWNSKQR